MIDQLAAYIIATAFSVLVCTLVTTAFIGLLALSYKSKKRVYRK
jgi:hypothetical protein